MLMHSEKEKLRVARFHPYISWNSHQKLLEYFLKSKHTAEIPSNCNKTEQESIRLATVLAGLHIFEQMIFDILLQAAGFMYLQHVKPGMEVFLPQNQACLCVINGGQFVSSGNKAKILELDSVFGENSFENDCQPDEQLICIAEGSVWILDTTTYLTATRAMACQLKAFKRRLVGELPTLSILPDEKLDQLLKLFSFVVYSADEKITDNWCEDSRFFFVVGGHVRITVRLDDGPENELAVLEPGACFGAWTPKSQRSVEAAVYAKDTVCCAILPSDGFSRFLNGMDDTVLHSTLSNLQMLAVSPIK